MTTEPLKADKVGAPSRRTHLALTAFFIALIGTAVVLNRRSPLREVAGASATAGGAAAIAAPAPLADAARQDALARYGFSLENVADRVGLSFKHEAPTLDPKLNHIMPQVASMGAAVAVGDYDKDGWPDLFVSNSGEKSSSRLFRNKGDGAFEDVTERSGLANLNNADTGVATGAVWGDYDNDGYEDLFVYKWGRPELFHNERGKGFARVTEKAGLPEWANANTAIWFDYDRDGKLDLFIGGYFPESLNLWRLKDTRIMPESFEYAQNGGRKWLLRGRGDGTFEDVTTQVGINSRRWALAAVAADLRGTGYPDLFVANDYGVSEMYANQGGRRFAEVGRATGVGYAPKSGMNAAVGDILNTGRFSVYVTNISEEGVLIQGNNLWVPREGTSGDAIRYDNLARDMGVELGGWSFGAQFGDLNNDGFLDLYVTNGYVSLDPRNNYWYDYSKVAGGNKAIIGDAANWPPMEGRSLSGYQKKRVWVSDGAGRFKDVAQLVGATDAYDGRSVALADLWNTGALDVIVANQRGPLLVYKNTVSPENSWVGFRLEGTKSNRSAIGAQVRLFWEGQQQVQEVSGGNGFCAQNDRRLHFGLGKISRVDKAVIRWPSGATQTIPTPKIGTIHTVKEPV